jgi:microsomal dipeptidase-like Zn-dependent dipeptidase
MGSKTVYFFNTLIWAILEAMKILTLFFILITFNLHAQTPPKGVTGYADLHVHMFANLGFAGGWFTGDPTALDKNSLFKVCAQGEEWSWFYHFLNNIDPYLTSFIYRNDCIPLSEKETFPAWNNLAHQQVWQEDLKLAHQNGLSLMILSAVHSYVLCRILPESRKNFESCEDRDNITRQLKAAKDWIEREKNWVGLATTPQEAREIHKAGKLIIILAVETENIFDHANWEEEFKEYVSLGVSTLQIVHQFNNKLAGAAIHQRPLVFASYLRNWLRFSKFEGFDSYVDSYGTPFDSREIKKNKQGLTTFGETILKKMMEHGMTVDFAHMSEQTMKDVQSVLKNNQNYPYYFSHGHFRDVMFKKNYGSYEKSSSQKVLEELKEINGIFGLRTMETGTHKIVETLDNNCDGSSLSFAHAYQYGRNLGVNIAFASDFNGFIPQSKPRFSLVDTNYCAPQKLPKLGKLFDHTGLGNIAQLSSLMEDLEQTGIDFSNLKNSAENYIQVWERSYALRKQ